MLRKNKRVNRYLTFIFLLVNFVDVVNAQQQSYSCFGPGGVMSGYGYGFGWVFGLIIWILIITALILLIIWLIKKLTGDERRRK